MYSGVYEVVNKVNGNRYVGATSHFRSRWKTHLNELRSGKHHAPGLQKDWNEHGADAFVFNKLLVCSSRNLLLYEQIYLDALQPEYNTCKVAGTRKGIKLPQSEIDRISRVSKRSWAANREKMMAAVKAGHAKLKELRKDSSFQERHKQNVRRAKQVNAKTLTYNGATKPLREWAEEYNIPSTTLHNRVKSGWTAERALTTPVFDINSKAFFDARRETCGHPVYEYKGQKIGLVELATALGVEKSQLWNMLRKRGPEGAIAYYEAVAEGNRPKTLRNVVCEYNGKPQSLLTLCEEFNAPYPTLSRRVKRYGLEETIKYYEAKRA